MFYRTLLFAFCTLTLITLAGCNDSSDSATSATPATITILHTNDVHSHLETFSVRKEPNQGGVARLKTLVNRIREEQGTDNVLVFDTGDYSQGTIFYNAWEGSEGILWLNDIGYDALGLGNHEFDLGTPKLVRALRGEPITISGVSYETEALQVPLVCANLDLTREADLNALVKPSIIIEKGGQQYGIIGVLTETTANIASPGENVVFLDYVTSVQTEVDKLEAQGINKIILLSHYGYNVDIEKAIQLSGVDVIISGHDHVLLADPAKVEAMGLSQQTERIAGPYPTPIKDKDGNTTLIVSAMEWGRWLGKLTVNFDTNGRVQENTWSGEALFVQGCTTVDDVVDCNNAVPEDTELKNKVTQYREPIDIFANTVVGQAGQFFDGNRNTVRNQEAAVGNLVTDVMLAEAKRSDGAVAAFTNSGGIRASINEGDVTYADVLAVSPFGNTVYVLDLTGQELVAALDNGFSKAGGQASGAFPQIAGMQASYCKTIPCNDTLIESGLVSNLIVNGTPVQMDAVYRIATNDYLANGGDFYTMLEDACDRGSYCRNTFVLVVDLLADEFTNYSPVVRNVEQRITAVDQ